MLWQRVVGRGLVAGLLCGALAGSGASAGDAGRRAEAGRRLGDEGRARERARNLEAQSAVVRSRSHLEVGRRFYEQMKYVQARDLLQKAVALDPTNKEAAELLSKVNDILGVRMPSVRTRAQTLAQEKVIRIQEKLVELDNAVKGAEDELKKAIKDPGVAVSSEQALAEQIRHANRAVELAERAREIMKWMPAEVKVDEQKEQARQLLYNAREARARKLADLRELKTRISLDSVRRQKIEEQKQDERKIEKLIDQVQMLFDNEEFKEAEKLAEEVLELAPDNFRAGELWYASREQQHRKKELELRDVRREEKLLLEETLREAGIPYSDYLVYPEDWAEVSRRESVEMQEAGEPQWKRDIRRMLDRMVSFEFVDTPLTEAIQFLQTLTKTTIILDPTAFDGGAGGGMPITLKVTDMPLRTALKWILRLADLDYTLKNEAVFISTPQRLAGEVDLKIYDVRDLTYTITNFPGPELILTTAGGGGGVGAGGMAGGPISIEEPPPDAIVAAGSLADLIMSRVQPTSWGAELGTSIEERSGKLVVMQKPEVHRLISKLLKKFRESQTLQVAVQSRFIEVRDSFLEDIGIEFADIPGQAMDPYDPIAPTPGYGLWTDNYVWPPPTQPPLQPPSNQIMSTLNPNHPFVTPTQTDTAGLLYYNESGNPVNSESEYWMRSTAYTNMVYPFGSRLPQAHRTAGSGQGAVFQFRYIGNVLAQAILHAVKKDEKGDLLLAPKITMYNNQRAYLMAAVQRAYISDYDISGSVFDPVISTIMTGTVLDVRPTVSHDRRYITMNMQPGTADHLQFETVVIGGDVNLPIQLPSIRFRSVRTTVTVPDGGTLLVSGLMTDVQFDASSGIPFFSDLPIVGRLFGTDLRQREKVNLLIMCTANLILFEEEEAKNL